MARVIVYDGREFEDPLPNGTVDEVRQYYASFFPELSNAETKTSKRGDDDVIEFKKRVGTKGAGEGQLSPRIIPPCTLGKCNVHNTHYRGGNWKVMDALRNGRCPICDNPTERKYIFGVPTDAYGQPLPVMV